MNFEEYPAKQLLASAGIPVPKGLLVTCADAAATAAQELGGKAVVKAQVPTGKRGKAGGIQLVNAPQEARSAATKILGMEIGGYPVKRLLIEEPVQLVREFYAAVMNDPGSKGPVVLFSAEGGMEIEEIFAANPDAIRQYHVDLCRGFNRSAASAMLAGLELGNLEPERLASVLSSLYRVYREKDAELLEINPLGMISTGDLVALDCKFTLDDAAKTRQPELAALGSPESATELERRGRELSLCYIELDGNVGVLANGAGLTMTTMDAIRYYGGSPANFLEIGGEAYTKATAALALVLANRNVKSLVINFCGAFARTDVMAAGVVAAWEELKPTLPVAFSIHGTGEEEAIALVRTRLGYEPYDRMDDAVKAAVEAAQ
ncbi:MAG: acetate--CoA ligase family protein [Acidobacteria bacterium]|nr:acetate--CoA ligase family protein [Acidobacteriota bacterium]